MAKSFLVVLLLAVAGCSNLPAVPQYSATSPCQVNEASYACQVERYHNVNVQ